MKFKFIAKSLTGKEEQGILEVDNKKELANSLYNKGLILISSQEIDNSKKFGEFNFSYVSLREKVLFASNLSAMLNAGLSLARCLEVAKKQTSNKYFSKVISNISVLVSEGSSFSKALGEYPKIFPPVFQAMVASGEESGNLPESLNLISEQLHKTYDLRRKVRGAMMYPAVILLAIIIIGVLMMIFLVPTLVETFNDLEVDLPISTQIVIAISDILLNKTLEVSIGLLILISIFISSFKIKFLRDKFHLFILKIPIIGLLIQKVQVAIILRSMSSLVVSGVGMLESIRITSQVVSNNIYKDKLLAGLELIQKGQTLSDIFRSDEKLFLVIASEMAEVGQETGNLSEMLMKGALLLESDVDQATKNLSTIVEPLLMVVVGLAVGFFAISMLGPMYSLTEAL